MVKFKWKTSKELEELSKLELASIQIKDGTDSLSVLDYITNKYPDVDKFYYDLDHEEILIEVPYPNDGKGNWGCSITQLRAAANEIAVVEVSIFDLDIQLKRRYCNKSTHNMKGGKDNG